MNKVILTFFLKKLNKEVDLEVSTNSTIGEVVSIICENYRLGDIKSVDVFALHLGRVLSFDETFEEAGVWSGSKLVLNQVK